MKRTYALRRLLEHGPLSFAELLAITGWPRGVVKAAVATLEEHGELQGVPCGHHRNLYRLTA